MRHRAQGRIDLNGRAADAHDEARGVRRPTIIGGTCAENNPSRAPKRALRSVRFIRAFTERGDHLFVAGLGEIFVKLAHSIEDRRRLQHDSLVGFK